MTVYELLLRLIEKEYYTREVIINKINFFFAMSQVSEEEYSTLMLKVEEVYHVVENVVVDAEVDSNETEINSNEMVEGNIVEEEM